jgi:hypothetical protein
VEWTYSWRGEVSQQCRHISIFLPSLLLDCSLRSALLLGRVLLTRHPCSDWWKSVVWGGLEGVLGIGVLLGD